VTPLGRLLAERIRHDGPIPVAEYMALCLGDPEHGYYRRAEAIGRSGDFITAPEISQMFGELIGLWAATMWESLGRPAPVRLVELGPGRGTLMADALRAIGKAMPAFRAAIDLHLIEINGRLRAQQEAVLSAARPTWHEGIAGVPSGPAIFIANEFFDALAVRQYQRLDDGWHERCVGLDVDGRLAFVPGPRVADPPLEPAHMRAPAGAVVEVSPASRDLALAIAGRIAGSGGAALVIDYGAPASGTGDTLQAVRQHKIVGPLEMPGESDLTTHVDFAALARAAQAGGAAAHGPVPQGVFLKRLGIVARAALLLRNAKPQQRDDIAAACERLIGEAQMGNLFQVLAITARNAPAPPGFDPLPPTRLIREGDADSGHIERD
jgi:NADH dehydrogenase [ubiquinone] 1 alpha subcomplex assembly factor 7